MKILKADHKLAHRDNAKKKSSWAKQMRKEKAYDAFRRSRAYKYIIEDLKKMIDNCYVENLLEDENKIAQSSDSELKKLMIGAIFAKKQLKKFKKKLTG